MDYKIIWDDEAIGELAQIVAHIAEDNPAAARKMGERILEKAKLLEQFPLLGKVFKKLGRDDVREILVFPYRVIYHVRDVSRSVKILVVQHGAREEPEIHEIL